MSANVTLQFYRHESKCTLNPGVIPTLNLPTKSLPPSSTTTSPAVNNHRDSAESISKKKRCVDVMCRCVDVANHTMLLEQLFIVACLTHFLIV